MATTDRFTMADLLDFEAQMARDTLAEPQALLKRDRGLKSIVIPGDRRRSLLAWIEQLRKHGDSWPGAKAQRSYELLAFIAVILGILSGSGLIQAMLHYDGSQPVNIIPLLAVYAILQLILILNYIFKATVYRLFKKLPGGALILLCREAAERWMQKRGTLVASGAPHQAVIKAYTQRLGQLHRALLQKHGWKLVQDFGIACHAASLLTFVGLLFFNDFTFGWRTTLQLQPDILHRMTSLLALPFAWLGDFATPSIELIQKSQFSRFQKGFVIEGLDLGARSTAAWWPFLALLITTYGLLPRLVIWLLLEFSIKKELAALPFDDLRSTKLWTRLSEEQSAWTSGTLASPSRPSEQRLYQHRAREPRDCVVLRWRDLPVTDAPLKECLAQSFALNAIRIINAQGLAADVDSIVKALGSQPQPLLVVACDPWELPGEAMERIRAALRERVSRHALILFAPLDETDGKAELSPLANKVAWQHAIQAFRDPYLGLLEAGESL